MYDPFVEAGYGGYSLRSVAHLQADKTFRPSLEIRDYRYGAGKLSYACAFEELYLDPDTALQRALDTGRQLIDNLLDLMNLDTRIETGVPPGALPVPLIMYVN
jgi:hypothetical protein